MSTYITIEEYKTWGNINSPNQDAEITQLLIPACETVQQYIGYELEPSGSVVTDKTFRYMFSHPEDTQILLPNTNAKVASVSLVSRNAVNTVQQVLDPESYYVDDMTGVLNLSQQRVSPRLGILVSFSSENIATDNIKLATYMLIDYWKNKDFKVEKTQGGQSVTSTPTRVLPKHIESILNASRGV